MKIPYATQWIEEDDIDAVSRALKADYLTQGPSVKSFEVKIAEYCGARYAVAVNSGTAALHAACFAAGISPADEVITSPITFVASSNCVLYCGGHPVFADIEEDTINIDPDEIIKKISKKTKALIPVHFSGHPCEMEKIYSLAREKNLVVIEDACHALGAEYNGLKIGAGKYSDMTALSFHAVKHITTGEGGLILTNNRDYYEKLMLFRTHGIKRDDTGDLWYYKMHFLGFNYRITDFQCQLGLSQLAKLDSFVARRREIVEKYQQAFSGRADIILPVEKDYAKSSWHLFCIRVNKDRRDVFMKLREKGILVNVHYIPVYWQPYYKNLGYKMGECPKAERYYSQAITLPLFPKMKDEDVDFVIKNVMESFKT